MDLLSADIKDFQSIKHITLKFGKFTVLVGPSSSGKSAALRSMRSLIRNSFVPSNVRQGSVKAVVSASFNDVSVASERGKSLSSYRLDQEIFTKCGRAVPEPVSDALHLATIGEVDPSFSFQFDRPFLLTESGATAASVIGSLTNVSSLHSAIKEANRRRLEASSKLKIRQSDVSELSERLDEFRQLSDQTKTLDEVESSLAEIEDVQNQQKALIAIVGLIEESQKALDQVVKAEDFDLSDIESMLDNKAKICALVDQADKAEKRYKELKYYVGVLQLKIDGAESEYRKTLVEAGICPTCGSEIHE